MLLPFAIRPICHDFKAICTHFGYISITAFLGVTVFNTLIYIAAHTSKAVNLSLIAVSSPIFIALFARLFLKDLFTPRRIFGLIAATSGVILLVTEGDLPRVMGLTFMEGDVWMILAAVIFGGYSILARIKPVDLGSISFLCSIFVLGLIFLVPWVIWEQRNVDTINLSSTAIAAIVYLGVGPSLIAFLCWNKAIMLVGPVRSAFVYYSLPVFSGVEALALLDEPVRFIHVLSGVLILFGVMVATRK